MNEICGLNYIYFVSRTNDGRQKDKKSKKLWELLKKRYAAIEKQRRTQLKIDLARIAKNDSESTEEYLVKISVITIKF